MLLGKTLLFTDGFTHFSEFGWQFWGFFGFLHFLVHLSLHVFVICDKKSWTNWDLNETAWSEHLPKSTLPLLAPHHPPIIQNFMTGDGDCCSFHGWHIDSLYGAQNINICWHYVSCGGQGGTGAFEPDWASSNCPHKGDCKQSQVAHSRENSGKIILIPISCCVWESLKKKKRKKKELNQLWDWLAFG